MSEYPDFRNFRKLSPEVIAEIYRGTEPPTPDELNRFNAEAWGEKKATPMTRDEAKEELEKRKKEFCWKNPELARRIPEYAWEKPQRYAELKRRYPESFLRKAGHVLKLQRLGLTNHPDLKEDAGIPALVRETELWLSEHQANPGPRTRNLSECHVVIEAMKPFRKRCQPLSEFKGAAQNGSVDGIATFEYMGTKHGDRWRIVCDAVIDSNGTVSEGIKVSSGTLKDWWKKAK